MPLHSLIPLPNLAMITVNDLDTLLYSEDNIAAALVSFSYISVHVKCSTEEDSTGDCVGMEFVSKATDTESCSKFIFKTNHCTMHAHNHTHIHKHINKVHAAD